MLQYLQHHFDKLLRHLLQVNLVLVHILAVRYLLVFVGCCLLQLIRESVREEADIEDNLLDHIISDLACSFDLADAAVAKYT
jgi:hypothetical protein